MCVDIGTYSVSEEQKQTFDSNFITKYDDPYLRFCLLLRPVFLRDVENFSATCSPDTDDVIVNFVGFLCVLSAKVCKPMCCPHLVS
jgi:hypothetical protein